MGGLVSAVLWDERGGEGWVLDSAIVSVSEGPGWCWGECAASSLRERERGGL